MIYIMDDFTIKNKALSIVAKRNSGKSELVKYLIIDAIRNKLFNEIFVISSTNCVNHFYNEFIEPTCIFDSYSEDWVEKLIILMSKKNDKLNSKDAYHVLLVIMICVRIFLCIIHQRLKNYLVADDTLT